MDRRALARTSKPVVCYAVEQIPPKTGQADLYTVDLPKAVTVGIATLKERLVIPACDARSWTVQAGELFRIVCSHGPQVADMNCWNLHHYQEHFYSSKTRQIHATHLTSGDRLWSNMPHVRPMATIVHETVQYGWDSDGAGVHDVIGSRCDPYTHHLMTGTNKDNCCHSNLLRTCLQDMGLSLTQAECAVHDVLNVFMCTGFTSDTHQYFTKPSPVQVGDYIEFLAEIDLRVAASTCPQGDVSSACGSNVSGNNNNNNNNINAEQTGELSPIEVYPLTVEIYQLPANWLSNKGWKPATCSGYDGTHGI